MDLHLNWTTCFAAAGYVAANPVVRQALGWAGRIARRELPNFKWTRLAAPASIAGLLMLALLAQVPADAQMRRGRYGNTSPGATADPSLKGAVATFDGTLRTITKKNFTVDLDNGNTVDFKIGKKTTFFVGTKEAKAKDMAAESEVQVEGIKDGFGVLTATKLTVKNVTAAQE
jgi:hypothetical protein